MRKTGKLDYLELPASGKIAGVKEFYSEAFGWKYTEYGPGYSAFGEGLDGGFDDSISAETAKPLPVLFSETLEDTLAAVERSGGTIVKPIFSFPGGRRFHFTDPAGNELAVWSEK